MPEIVFHLVPLCPFSCQTKDFNTTFSQPELVSSVPFPYVPLIWTKIDARDSVRHCSLLSLLLWSEDQVTFTEIICAEQSPLFRFAGSLHCFGLQEVSVCRKHNSAGILFLKSWFFNGNCLLKKLCSCHFGFWVLIWRFCIQFIDQFCFFLISCGALFVVNLPFKLLVFSLHLVDQFSW